MYSTFLHQVAEKLEAVTEEREELLTKWEVKKEALNQMQAEQVFLRDVEQLHTISSQQEVCVRVVCTIKSTVIEEVWRR